MKHTDWCRDWSFQYGEPSNFPGMKPKTQTVTLPHDAMIEGDVKADAKGGAETGFYQGTKASYTKYLDVSEEGRKYILAFDGVAGAMKLIVNGNLVMRHHYAYSPFQADITPYLTKDHKNRVTVTVNNTNEPNSRWYSGAGLYRKVELLTGSWVHIVPNGVFVRTDRIENGKAHLHAEITIANDGDRDAEVSVGAKVKERSAGGWLDTGIRAEEKVLAGKTMTLAEEFTIDQPQLWALDRPALYELNVAVTTSGLKEEALSGVNQTTASFASSGQNETFNSSAADVDTETAVFGIRTITMDAENGLRLNGKNLKLKGGCIHHDNGILGAAAVRDAEYRKVRLLKENGFNAIRFAHNPMSGDLLRACDEIGMLVIDEAFDVWNMEKDDFDFSQYFDKEGETELANMIRRDRNHPCIFLWSIGNEIPEQGGLSGGYETSRRLAAKVRSLDPSRAVGGALCSFFRGLSDADNEKYWASVMANAAELKKNGMVNLDCAFGKSVFDPYTTPFVQDWDAVGYNYLQYHYESTHKTHPDRVMIATESKPRELFSYWEDVKRLPYLIGDFEWTALDYLGEAGIGDSCYVEEKDADRTRMMMFRAQFPSRTAGSGDFDLCGFEKPQLAYRRIVWGSKETAIMTHDPAHNGKVELLGRYSWGDVQHGFSWDVELGTEIRAEVYSGAAEVELFLNGKSLGKKKPGGSLQETETADAGKAKNTGDAVMTDNTGNVGSTAAAPDTREQEPYKAMYTFPYEPGTLTAVSYDASGAEVSRDTVKSAGAPVGLKLTAQQTGTENSSDSPLTAVADGQSLVYVTVEIVDANGQRVPWAEDTLQAEVTGAASLAGFGSGRSATTENYTAGQFTTYEGRTLAILRSGWEAGDATLTVRGEKFGEKTLTISLAAAD